MGLGELEAGDTLLSRYGLVTVAQVTSHPAAPVYNISVQQQHVYEVTEWGILTHNTCFVISPAEGGGYNVLRDGKVIKTFKSGDNLADKAAAKAYRRNAEKVAEKETAAAAKSQVPMEATSRLSKLIAAAEALGYRLVNEKSHGQPVFTNGKTFITPDIDGHNVTGGWKMAKRVKELRSKTTRMGTYDPDLTRIGD